MNHSLQPLEVSFPLPRSPHTTLHAHITFLTTSTMLFLTTNVIGESSSTRAPMGSFVYAMPDVCLIRTSNISSDPTIRAR